MQDLPWWRADVYSLDEAVPDELWRYAGPRGVGLVRAWPNGKTDPGWGIRPTEKSLGFMKSYMAGRFRSDIVKAGFESGRWSFAFVMRSVRLVCIDIDGKNGGFTHAGQLGMLPYTLTETSKSGDGYHLIYATLDDEWDPDLGYAKYTDRIGLEQGVDLRAVGCVYHYPQQRWNGRPIAELPQHLKDRLLQHKERNAGSTGFIINVLETGDELEVAVMQDAILTDLNKPIPAGKRNTTLFAIGSQMFLAQVPNWANLVHDRALDVGLDLLEADKLIANITKYGSTAP